MSPSDSAHYTFLPWVRQGAARNIKTVDSDPTAALNDSATIAVTVQANTAAAQSVTIALYGPGIIQGFDPSLVARTDPRHLTSDFEPNYCPCIEFSVPTDSQFRWLFTPWLFTPAAPSPSERLRPWICLVVVPKRAPDINLNPALPLPVLSIKKVAPRNIPAYAELPDLSQSWAWAHAQLTGSLIGDQSLDDILVNNPERIIMRLICPRALDSNTSYYACVVPTFEAGRLAGLGQTPPANNPALGPAWTGTTEEIDLPVYYQWEFTTGAEGDFESLALLLERRDAPAGAGNKDMDISHAGSGLPEPPAAAAAWVVGLEGALRAPGTPHGEPPPKTFQDTLRTILNAPTNLKATDPSIPSVVAPPIYGSFHAARTTVPEDPPIGLGGLLLGLWRTLSGTRRIDRPHWLRELNLDPRYRAVAGIATRVIQEEQEQLMTSAWQQVGEIERANQELRQAQLARSVGKIIFQTDLAPLEAGALLQIAQPAHSRVLMSPYTLAHLVQRSIVPRAALTVAFRRVTRPRGPLARRLNPSSDHQVRPLIQRLNAGEIVAAGARHVPSSTTSIDQVSDSLYPSWIPSWFRPFLSYLLWIVLILLLLVLIAISIVGAGLLLSAVAAFLAGVIIWLRQQAPRFHVADEVRTTRLTPDVIASVQGRPDFTVVPEDATAPPSPSQAQGPDSPAAVIFRQAAQAHQKHLTDIVHTPVLPSVPPLELDAIRTTLLAKIDPEQTVPTAVLSRIDTNLDDWEPDDPIEPILAVPQFPTPMYDPLRQIAKDLLLPGVDEIPPNSILLLETNPRFIEAYMVALNHEIIRELLWREYPIGDPRGTCFRQFWDPRGHVPAPQTEAEQEALKDIPPIHTWPSRNHLGDTEAKGKPEGLLVLLIRGQLLLRYPTTLIYASKANMRPNQPGRKPLEGDAREERYPIFLGTFPPDITFMGFDLTADEARGGPAPTESGTVDPGPGWFIVLQQPPAEMRFGLDPAPPAGSAPSTSPTTGVNPFDDLTWADVAIKNDHIDVDNTGKDPKIGQLRGPLGQSWGSHSANMAYITLQRPFRVAISADDMLPPLRSS